MSAKRALILDLDDTLVNTQCLASLRDRRAWKECVQRASETTLFDGLLQVLQELQQRGVKIGVVTASVSFYALAILKHHGIAPDVLVAYHDCAPRKPHPAPVQLCLTKLASNAAEAVGLGDADIDAAAYIAAGVVSLGAGWSPSIHRSAGWDKILDHPGELVSFF